MRFLSVFLFISLTLVGCSSEVDKCVDAKVKGWEAEQNRLKEELASGKKTLTKPENQTLYSLYNFEPIVKLDERTKAEVEAEYRGWCLRVSRK